MINIPYIRNLMYDAHVIPNLDLLRQFADGNISKKELYQQIVDRSKTPDKLSGTGLAASIARFGLTLPGTSNENGPTLEEFLNAEDDVKRRRIAASHLLLEEGGWAFVWMLNQCRNRGLTFTNYDEILDAYGGYFGQTSDSGSAQATVSDFCSNLQMLGILDNNDPRQASVDSEEFATVIGFEITTEITDFQNLSDFQRQVVSYLVSMQAFDQQSGVTAMLIHNHIRTHHPEISFDSKNTLHHSLKEGAALHQYVNFEQLGAGYHPRYWVIIDNDQRRDFLTSAVLGGVSDNDFSLIDAILRPLSSLIADIDNQPDNFREGEALENLGARILQKFGFRDLRKWDKEGSSEIDVFGRRDIPLPSQCLVQCKQSTGSISARILLGELAIARHRSCDVVVFMTNGKFSPPAVLEGNKWSFENAMNLILFDGDALAKMQECGGDEQQIHRVLEEWWKGELIRNAEIRTHIQGHDALFGRAAIEFIERQGGKISTLDEVISHFPEWYSLGESLREGITRVWLLRQDEN